MKTREKDLIQFTIEPGAGSPGGVEFVFELYSSLAWRKELELVTDHGILTMEVDRHKRSDDCGLLIPELPGTKLRFRKDKGPGEPIIFMETILELDGLEYLPAGARVSFRWVRDR